MTRTLPSKVEHLFPDQVKAAHQAADDAGAVGAAFPPAEAWKKEFPNDYSETPDGKYRVAYRNQGNTAEQNERNSQKALAMIKDWQRVGAETSARRDAAVPTVRVRGMDGVTMHIPAAQEANAAKKGMRPAIKWGRATRYWTDQNGHRWKRRHGGEWESDE